jgi:serine phosphatase RsbU (regulator of sigma subunit)
LPGLGLAALGTGDLVGDMQLGGKQAARTGGLAARHVDEEMSSREARAAIGIAAALYVVGAALTATAALLPHVSSPAGVVAVAAAALLTAAGLVIAFIRRRGGLGLACIVDLWGVVLIALLCAATGGASSPFGLIYFFALGHAAAFQPRGRLILVSAAVLLAFLAPLAYEDVSTTFGAIACVAVVLALLASGVIHLALERMREQRRRLEFLIGATANLDTSLDPAQTLRKIARTAVPDLAELCVIDLLDRRGSIGDTVAASVDPAVASGVERMRRTAPLRMDGSHPVSQVLSSGKAYVINDLTDRVALRRIAQSDEHVQFMQDSGYRSAAVFPMVARGRTHGAISFLHLHGNARYEPDQLAVLEDLTGRAAMALDNARLYAERAHVARTLQRSLMPATLPAISGLELASCFRPMGAGNEVGGDFYDAFGDRESFWLIVGDVCGKGAEAAALTGFLRYTTVAHAREDTSPEDVLSHVNRAMLDQDFDGRFATAILARLQFLEPDAELTIAAAGHPAALVARADGHAEELGGRGTLLGVFPDAAIQEVTTILKPGDTLALYTDGLLEAHAPNHTLTLREMIERLEHPAPRCAKDVVDALIGLADLQADVRDDVAVLCARLKDTTG